MGSSGLPHVTEVHHMADGTVRVHVAVDDFKDGQQVEVSGTITQSDGTYTSFHWTQKVARPSGSNPGDPADLEVPVGMMDLTDNEDVTVVTRVAEVWSTVLTKKDPGPGMRAAWSAKYPSSGSGGSEYPAAPAVPAAPGKDQG